VGAPFGPRRAGQHPNLGWYLFRDAHLRQQPCIFERLSFMRS
jgi:hypothetical protein